jgi:hypothetical protein
VKSFVGFAVKKSRNHQGRREKTGLKRRYIFQVHPFALAFQIQFFPFCREGGKTGSIRQNQVSNFLYFLPLYRLTGGDALERYDSLISHYSSLISHVSPPFLHP